MEFNELLATASKDGVQKIVVGAILTNKENKVLLLQRSDHEFCPNLWEFPSGGVEIDESLSDALYREVKEETSIELNQIVQYVNSFDYTSQKGKKTRQINFLVRARESTIKLSDEHKNYVWVGIEDLSLHKFDSVTLNLLKAFFKKYNT